MAAGDSKGEGAASSYDWIAIGAVGSTEEGDVRVNEVCPDGTVKVTYKSGKIMAITISDLGRVLPEKDDDVIVLDLSTNTRYDATLFQIVERKAIVKRMIEKKKKPKYVLDIPLDTVAKRADWGSQNDYIDLKKRVDEPLTSRPLRKKAKFCQRFNSKASSYSSSSRTAQSVTEVEAKLPLLPEVKVPTVFSTTGGGDAVVDSCTKTASPVAEAPVVIKKEEHVSSAKGSCPLKSLPSFIHPQLSWCIIGSEAVTAESRTVRIDQFLDSLVKVTDDQSLMSADIALNSLLRIDPEEQDSIFFNDDNQIRSGRLLSIEGSEAIIKLDHSNEYKVMLRRDLVKKALF